MTWKRYHHYWHFVRRIHWSQMDSPKKPNDCLHRWSLEKKKYFHPRLYWAYDNLFMLGLKVIHVSEWGTRKIYSALHNRCQYGKKWLLTNTIFSVYKEVSGHQPHYFNIALEHKWIEKNIGEILCLLNKSMLNHFPIIIEIQFSSPHEPCWQPSTYMKYAWQSDKYR